MMSARDIVLQAFCDAGLSVVTTEYGTAHVGTNDPRIDTLIRLMLHAVDKCQRDALEAAAEVAKRWADGFHIAREIRALMPREDGNG